MADKKLFTLGNKGSNFSHISSVRAIWHIVSVYFCVWAFEKCNPTQFCLSKGPFTFDHLSRVDVVLWVTCDMCLCHILVIWLIGRSWNEQKNHCLPLLSISTASYYSFKIASSKPCGKIIQYPQRCTSNLMKLCEIVFSEAVNCLFFLPPITSHQNKIEILNWFNGRLYYYTSYFSFCRTN